MRPIATRGFGGFLAAAEIDRLIGLRIKPQRFDADALKAGRAYLVEDFPASSTRYVVDSDGYKLTVVNGEILIEEGKHSGALPGEVLKGSQRAANLRDCCSAP